jgi:pyridoxal phosphate enzyme (YggS family)
MTIGEAVQELRERVEKAAIRSGRDPGAITLMGVSKFHGIEAVEAAYAGGVRVFGESRVQEAREKFPAFLAAHPELELHLIGTLQRNKAKAAASLFSCVQSVDRDELVEALGRAAVERGEALRVLLELHTAEDSKSGYPDLDALIRGAEKVRSSPGLLFRGLMTMAPFTGDTKAIRASFRTLYGAGEKLKTLGFDAPVLSMGMSGDFEIAIEEGSTLLRIGTLIFGERNV